MLLLLLILAISGCASDSGSSSQTGQWISAHEKTLIGGLGAATAGGLIGAAFHAGPAGVIGGALLGGLLGAAVGDRMDAADKREQAQAAQKALETTPSGKSVAWRNPDTGNNGTVTPDSKPQGRRGGKHTMAGTAVHLKIFAAWSMSSGQKMKRHLASEPATEP